MESETNKQSRFIDTENGFVVPDLDDCGDNFMGVYICQNWSNCITKFLTFFLKIKVYLI